ncbi:MAG: NAD(P)H-dependent oxidoreductase subunit E [Luminiphilus sp.]|jgi:formate dehydrogenase subunit gamma|nr:NAD(P)H-dependent oxidoreductase subunit E [Luminiphilus sp.]
MESPIKTPEQIAVLKGLLTPIADCEPGPVLLCLQAVQIHFGYVPEGAVGVVAEVCNVTRADVHGVFSYYSDLKKTPPPAVSVRLCAAEACQAVGGRSLAAAWGEACAADPKLAAATGTNEPVFCLGNCALGPAALVNEELIGNANIQALKLAVEAAQNAAETAL